MGARRPTRASDMIFQMPPKSLDQTLVASQLRAYFPSTVVCHRWTSVRTNNLHLILRLDFLPSVTRCGKTGTASALLQSFESYGWRGLGFCSGVPLASCVLVISYSFHAPLSFQCSPWFQHTTIPRSQIYPIIAKLPPITTNHPPIISKVHAQTPSSHL